MTIWAKSLPDSGITESRFSSTLYGHTRQCLDTADVLIEHCAEAMVRTCGLQNAQIKWFGRALRWATILHDLGKATDVFARLVAPHRNSHTRPPVVRHEVISYWIVAMQKDLALAMQSSFTEMGDWAVDQLPLVYVAILGHHLKFPRRGDIKPEHYTEEPITILWSELAKDDVWGLLTSLAGRRVHMDIDMPAIPGTLQWMRKHVQMPLQDHLEERSWSSEVYMLGSILRGALIAVDTIGSIACLTEEAWEEVLGQLRKAFAHPTVTDSLEQAIAQRVGGNVESELTDFQDIVAAALGDPLIVKAGCGSGKTVAILRRAQETKARGLIMTAPTTAVATQLYVDYGMHMSGKAQLLHSRSVVDMDLLASPVEDKEVDGVDESVARYEAMERLVNPVTFCTVDLVVGLLSNRRTSLALLPRIATSLIVFDEAHLYEPRLFNYFREFLRTFKVSAVVMSASLTKRMEQAIQGAAADRPIAHVYGPKLHETRERYDIEVGGTFRSENISWVVASALEEGKKILLVANTVVRARSWFEQLSQQMHESKRVTMLHSHFKYEDRARIQRHIVESFKEAGRGFCAVTTQICEVSFDVSADLLISELAPFPSMIQRLGRLNRRAKDGDPTCQAIFVEPANDPPYTHEELETGRQLLARLLERKMRGISQADLDEVLSTWVTDDVVEESSRRGMTWFDLLYTRQGDSARSTGHTISVLLKSDIRGAGGTATSLSARLGKILTLPLPKSGLPQETWRYCYIVDDRVVSYSPILGGWWNDRNG